MWLSGKESACNTGDTGNMGLIHEWGGSPGEEMTTHSHILAGKIPWTEEPGELRPMGLQRVGHDWENSNFQKISSVCMDIYLFFNIMVFFFTEVRFPVSGVLHVKCRHTIFFCFHNSVFSKFVISVWSIFHVRGFLQISGDTWLPINI